MNCVRISIAACCAFAAVAGADNLPPMHSLDLAASTPQVDVGRRGAARNYLRLPSLDYEFRLTARCTGNFKPLSVSLSIADTQQSLSQDQLNAERENTELTVHVPANQLAPLVIEKFCVELTDDAMPDSVESPLAPDPFMITVPAALSAQASLLCVNEQQQEIVYKSHALDITLICSAQKERIE